MQALSRVVPVLAIAVSCAAALGCSNGDNKTMPKDEGHGASAGSGATTSSEGGEMASGGTSSSSSGTSSEAGSDAVLPTPEEHSYDADDPNIQYMGRMDWTDAKAPRFAASAVQLRATFVGTGASVKILDENRYGQNKNYFEVLVDDQPAIKLTALKTQTSYEVAKDLPNGEHTITIAKRTEPAVGYSSFMGLTITGELVEPPPPPERRLELSAIPSAAARATRPRTARPNAARTAGASPTTTATWPTVPSWLGRSTPSTTSPRSRASDSSAIIAACTTRARCPRSTT